MRAHVTYPIELHAALHRKLRIAAAERDLTLKDFIIRVLEEAAK